MAEPGVAPEGLTRHTDRPDALEVMNRCLRLLEEVRLLESPQRSRPRLRLVAGGSEQPPAALRLKRCSDQQAFRLLLGGLAAVLPLA
jgi:hypothetical protein